MKKKQTKQEQEVVWKDETQIRMSLNFSGFTLKKNEMRILLKNF